MNALMKMTKRAPDIGVDDRLMGAGQEGRGEDLEEEDLAKEEGDLEEDMEESLTQMK